MASEVTSSPVQDGGAGSMWKGPSGSIVYCWPLPDNQNRLGIGSEHVYDSLQLDTEE